MSNPFNVLNNDIQEITETDKNLELNEQIKNLLNSSKVVLFMKGNADMPMCGFSANTVAILRQLAVPFKTFNILNDPEIRQGLKEFSNWPTYPQLYVGGRLIGGNDIVTEMYQSGELQEFIKNN
jgi:monothiol glutaredoxin